MKYIAIVALGLAACATVEAPAQEPAEAAAVDSDKVACMTSAIGRYAGTFNSTGFGADFGGGISSGESTFTAIASSPTAIDYIDDNGASTARWEVIDDHMQLTEFDVTDGSTTNSYEVAIQICEARDNGDHYVVEEWMQPADPDAESGTPGAKAWDMRHEHWLSGDKTMTLIQVRPAGSEGVYRTVGAGLGTRQEG